jgi:hypothetical protein
MNNLSRKRLGNTIDRSGLLNDVKSIPSSVNYLAPNMGVVNAIQDRDSQMQTKLRPNASFTSPLAQRHRSVAPDPSSMGNGLELLLPGAKVSPESIRNLTSRFKTPTRDLVGHVTENPMRYLNTAR